MIDRVIKGEFNLLTKQEDFYSQVIVASELICRGNSDQIDLQSVSKSLTYQLKKS